MLSRLGLDRLPQLPTLSLCPLPPVPPIRRRAASYSATTPAEIYVTLLRSDGTVAVRAQRAPVTPQARNLIGVYRDVDGALRLNQLQAGCALPPSLERWGCTALRCAYARAHVRVTGTGASTGGGAW